MTRFSWGVTPKASVAAACRRYGQTAVVQACLDLLAGQDVAPDLVDALGGPDAHRRAAGPRNGYWLRVWAVRGLLWNWEQRATPALVAALGDEAWRVRELAVKVVARHLVDEGVPLVASLAADPVPRVRSAAVRALRRLGDAAV